MRGCRSKTRGRSRRFSRSCSRGNLREIEWLGLPRATRYDFAFPRAHLQRIATSFVEFLLCCDQILFRMAAAAKMEETVEKSSGPLAYGAVGIDGGVGRPGKSGSAWASSSRDVIGCSQSTGSVLRWAGTVKGCHSSVVHRPHTPNLRDNMRPE